MESAPAIGIDLGTTFSAAAVYRRGKCEIIPNKEGDRLTPSLVYYHADSLEVSVGTTAYDLSPQKTENFLFDIKRIMGRKYDDAYVQRLKSSEEHRFNIVRGDDDKAAVELVYNGVTVCKTPEEICSEILKYLRESATVYLGVEVTEAVISVPAYFSNAQRKATQTAAELAGLKVLKLITDPVAAAIHYSEDRLNIKSTLLVFDFGGGTLDVSIIEVDGKSFAVKSVEGDTFLGGRDFDQILFEHFKSDIIRSFDESIINDRLLRRVKESCNRLKIKLSICQDYHIVLWENEDRDFTMSMTRMEFEQLIQQHLSRAERLLDKCLNKAGMIITDITDVVLVGAATRIPKVREMLTAFFSREEIRKNLNPDEAVALGAGIQAALITEPEIYNVTEITPFSLGLGIEGDFMSVIIKKNSPLPVISMPFSCYTTENNQKQSRFQIFEGERKNCQLNNLLGEFVINDLPPGKEGDVTFDVVFTLNEHGILEVKAYYFSAGKKQKLVVTIGEFHLCDCKIRQTIEDARENKKDDDVFVTFTRYLWMVKRICNHVNYDLNKIKSDDERSFVKSKCEHFQDVMKNLEYTELDRLKHAYNSFKTLIIGIVNGVMDVKFDIESS